MERAALSLSSVGWLTRKFMEIESWCEPLRGERCHVPRFHLRGKGSRGVHLESWWLADSNGEDLSSTTSADLVEGSGPKIRGLRVRVRVKGEVLLKVCGRERVNRCPIRRAPNFR